METSQISYSRPYSSVHGQIVLLVLACAAATSSLVYGHMARTSQILWMSFYLLQIANVILDPKISFTTTQKTPDGTAVRVRRPLIGFKKCESVVDFDGKTDGDVRNGRAFIRL